MSCPVQPFSKGQIHQNSPDLIAELCFAYSPISSAGLFMGKDFNQGLLLAEPQVFSKGHPSISCVLHSCCQVKESDLNYQTLSHRLCSP